jgi:radical SAM/SPASM domain protein of ACGX system
MSFPDMKAVLNNIKEFCRKAEREPYLYITGGDPILHPRFWDLLEMLKEDNIRIAILGNPFHLTPENCRRMRECGVVKYQLSLDGLKETHDRIRQPGSYESTMSAIPMLRDAGIDVAIMSTVSKWNVSEMPSLVDEVVRNKADNFAFARYCPSMEDRETTCSPEEYREMMDRCWSKFREYGDSGTTFNLKDHLWTLYRYENGDFHIGDYPDDDYVYDGCNCGNSHLTILSDGSVYACRRMESRVGNALEDDLYDLFTGPKMDPYRIYENFEKCSKCELLRFCRGCPAVAKGYHGNMYAPDPQCWKVITVDESR